MNRTISIAPVRNSIVVQATVEETFEVLTAGIDCWLPKSKGSGAAPIRESVEPLVGGRWYTEFEDATEAVIGHAGIWQPPERFVMTWEIGAAWKPDPRVAAGWSVYLSSLKLYLETGKGTPHGD